jgi:hypothetical protein
VLPARRNAAHLEQARELGMMADFEWEWPTHINRPTVERVLVLDFLAQRENVIVVASHGPGKTMMAKNLVHEELLSGPFRALQHRLRIYMRPTLLAIDEVAISATTRTPPTCFSRSSAAATHRSLW